CRSSYLRQARLFRSVTPMKYMMFVVADPAAAGEATSSEGDLTIEQWLADVEGRGKRITGNALRPVSEAVTVRVSRGQVLVTDGPFSETKEWIAGFDILECDDLDEAIAIAARHPQANGGELGLRPFWTGEDLRSRGHGLGGRLPLAAKSPQPDCGQGRDEPFHKYQGVAVVVCPGLCHGTCEMVALANYGQALAANFQ